MPGIQMAVSPVETAARRGARFFLHVSDFRLHSANAITAFWECLFAQVSLVSFAHPMFIYYLFFFNY